VGDPINSGRISGHDSSFDSTREGRWSFRIRQKERKTEGANWAELETGRCASRKDVRAGSSERGEEGRGIKQEKEKRLRHR